MKTRKQFKEAVLLLLGQPRSKIDGRRKKMKTGKLIIGLAAFLAMAVIIGCASKPQAKKSNDIFANDDGGLLIVNNETNVDIILFAGRITQERILGGVRAMSSRTIDITKIAIPAAEGAFIIHGVQANNYQQKKVNITADDILYSGLVVYDLKNTDKIQKTIPNVIDETASAFVVFSNNSRSVCELRLNSPNGTAIIALRPYEMNRRLWIKLSSWDGYVVFPNLVGYENGEIKNVSNSMRGMPFLPVPSNSNAPMMIINIDDNYESKGMRMNLLFE